MTSIRCFLTSADPLSRDAAVFLSKYCEEDSFVDYKLNIDVSSEREWLELTKDVSAFANTHGGYLFFGVDDSSKSVVGISNVVADTLRDVNNIHQKVNRHLEPHITSIRSKIYRIDGRAVALLFIPQSKGRTHVIAKDGEFNHPSGKAKTVLRKGTFYVRRSGGNHLGDSRDLDDVIERRIDQFREALLDKVTKVINTPASSNVFILSRDPEDKSGQRFIIEDSPDAIAIKGMSFTVAPEGFEEKIAAWTVLSGGRPESSPPASALWDWYAHRKQFSIGESHKLAVFQFSLWNNAPPFYWIRGLKNAAIRSALLSAIRLKPSPDCINHMLVVASFLGKNPFKAALAELGAMVERLAPGKKVYPPDGPQRAYVRIKPRTKQPLSSLRNEQEALLGDIAASAAKAGTPPPLMKVWRALEIDCFLYAQDDRYK